MDLATWGLGSEQATISVMKKTLNWKSYISKHTEMMAKFINLSGIHDMVDKCNNKVD